MERKNLKEMKKRLLALLLCITMVLNGGISTFAEETNQPVHEHTEECKTLVKTDKLICTKPEVEETAAHKHTDDACYEITCDKELTCELEATEGHSHGEGCYALEKKLICEEAEHEHSDACYVEESKLTCELKEVPAHTHGEECYTLTESKNLTCKLEEAEAHTHGEDCYEWIEELKCEFKDTKQIKEEPETEEPKAEELTKTEYSAEGEDGEVKVTVILENAADLPDNAELITEPETLDEDETVAIEETAKAAGIYIEKMTALDIRFEREVAGEEGAEPTIENPQPANPVNVSVVLPDITAEDEVTVYHVGKETVTDENGEEKEVFKVEDMDASVNAETGAVEFKTSHFSTYVFIKNIDTAVAVVIAMIDQLPTYEEVAEALAKFEAEEDWEGYENYIKDLAEKAWKAYYAYEALNEEEKALVTNHERLMETSGIWSMMTLPNNSDTAATKYYSPSSEFWKNSKLASECDCTWELTNDEKHETHENCIPVKHEELIPSAYGANGLTLGAKSADEIVISDYIKNNLVLKKDENGGWTNLTDYKIDDSSSIWGYLRDYNNETTVKVHDPDDSEGEAKQRQKDLKDGYYLIYRNVGSYKGQPVDLKIQYKDIEIYDKQKESLIGFKTILENEGELVVPEINVLNVAWVEMEYTFYEAGTDTKIAVKGNTSYYDVDANQAVYMKDNCKGVYLTDECELWIGQLNNDSNACGLYQGKDRIKYDRYDPKAAFTEIFEGEGFTRVFSFSQLYTDAEKNSYYKQWVEQGLELSQDAYNMIGSKGYGSGTIGHSGRPVVLDGVLYINKTVQGATGNVSNEKYDFKITFSDATMNTSETVSYGDVNVINGVAEFTLGHGDAVQISGLQAGVGYTVEEINTTGRMYTTVNGVEGTSISGKVESVTETSEIPVISFVNIPVEVITDKKVSGDNEDDMVLTLDAFATGSLSSMVKTKPADIVVVFDHSGSMLKALEAKRKLTSFTQLEAEKGKIEGYYVSSNDSETVFLLYKNDTWHYVKSGYKLSKYTPLNWDGAFAESNFSDNKLLKVDSETQKILEKNGIYQTRYGAAYDALMEFASMMQKTGIDHRLAITTFAHGDQGGTGVFIDGTFYPYNTFTESGKSYKDALEDISDETSVKNIKQSIEKLYSGWGYTYTNIGLTMANNILDTLDTDANNGEQERDRMVVLLSDGLPSNKSISKDQSKNLALAQAKIAKSEHNATIYAIGVLGENDTEAANVLQRISSNYDYSGIDTPNMSSGTMVSDKYYQNVTSDAAMKLAFGNVVLQVGGTQIQLDHTAILRDTLSAEFQLDLNRDIQVYTADCTGYAEGKYTFGEKAPWTEGRKLQDDDEEVLGINVNGATIDVTGFDYEKYYVAVGDNGSGEQVARGCKLIVEIPIKAADDNPGGIKQATNDDDQTGIYDGDLRVEDFPDPYADVPVKVEVIKHIDGISTSESFAFNASYDGFTGYSNIPSGEINGSNYLNAIRSENKATGSEELTDYDTTKDVWVLQDVLAGGTVTVTEDDSERYEMSVSVTHLDKNGNRVASEYSLSGNSVEVKNVQPGTRIEFTNTEIEGDVKVNKEVKDIEGKLWIDLEAYTTGYTTTISKIKPTDIILVLDHSGSMFHAVHIGEPKTIKTNAGQTTEEYQIADAISYDELNAKEEVKNIYAAGHRGYYMMINANKKSIWCVQYDGTQWLKYEMKPQSAETLYQGRVKSYCEDSTGKPLTDSDKADGFFYKSIYGESCDALKVFLDEVKGTQNCRVAMVGFAGADEQHYIGSGVYKDGAFWQYDSQMYASEDFKTKVFEKVDTTEGMDALYASLAAYQPKYNTTATNVGLRITQILMQKATDQETTPVVVIFTDGEPTVTNMGHGYSNEWNGLSKSEQARNHAIALATELKQGKCIVGKEEHYKTQIFTIAPESTQVDKEYLESLASPGKAFTAAAGAMTGVFKTVAETVTASATTLDEESILRDVLSADFVLDKDRKIEIYLSEYENGAFADNGLIHADAHEEGCDDCTDIKAVVDGNTIEVTGFDYSAHCVVGANEKAAKIVVRVPILPSDTNLGGNQQKTNDHAEIEDDGKVVKPFPDPYVDIPTSITIKKVVERVETSKEFNFNADYVTITGYEDVDLTTEGDSNYLKAITSEVNGKAFALGNGNEFILDNVMVGSTVTISEEFLEAYTVNVTVMLNGQEYTDIKKSDTNRTVSFTVQPGMVVTFTNTSLYELPSTGGIGTYLYSISGPVLMMGAALILYRMKRKEVLGR